MLITGSGVTRVITFVNSIILARQLGPGGFGEFSVFYSLMMAFGTSTTFIDNTYVRYANTAEPQKRISFLRGCFEIKIAFLLLVFAFAYPLSWLLSNYLFQKPELKLSIFIAILCGSILGLLSMKASIHQAVEDFFRFTGLNLIFYLVVFIILLIFLLLKFPFTTKFAYATYLTASLGIGTMSFVWLYRLSKPLLIEKNILIQILSFAKWLFAANLVYVIFQRLDLLILARYVDFETVGQYGAALRIVVIVSLMTGSLSPLLLPRATRTNKSLDNLKNYLKHAIFISGVLSFFIAIIWLAVPIIVHQLFGNIYARAISLTRVLLVGMIFVAIYTPLTQLFLSENSPKKMFYLGLIKLNAILWLSLILVPQFKAQGTAWSVVASEFLALIYTVMALRTKLWSAFREEPQTLRSTRTERKIPV